MKGSSIGYLSKEGLKNIWINRLMSVASVGILSACLLILGFTILISASLNSMMKYIEGQVEIVLFIRDDVSEEKIEQARGAFLGCENVTGLIHTTKQEAFLEQQEALGDKGYLLTGLEDVFPASFRITVENLSDISEFRALAGQLDIHEAMRIPEDFANTLVNIRNAVSSFSIVAIIALVIISVIVISNTIRASVFARRTEIGIMKQVGATDNFIRIPFIIEGAVIGLIAAGLAFGLLHFSYAQLSNSMGLSNSPFLTGFFDNMASLEVMRGQIILYFASGGLVTGVISSVLSLRSYLKV
ncbi:MAG: ABC transporter permease [Oscillospiraceae bacterium]|nr:ABC transporter permease [Oscillospiraceae bacterium]